MISISKETIEKIIGRLLTDCEWAKSFFDNPDEALKEYELIAGLKALKKEDVDKLSGSLDER